MFKYRLQPLLDLKTERKSQLQVSVAQRQKELAAEQEELAGLRRSEKQREEQLRESRRAMLAGSSGWTGLAIQQYRDYLSGLEMDLEIAKNSTFSQQQRVREFEDRLAESKRDLNECLREIDVLNKHHNRLRLRFLRAIEQKEAAEQDEIGTSMFLKKEALR
jgi:flagellar biosynthesis chaperone FliJ